MEFKNWLYMNENTAIHFTMFSSDGKIRVLIGNKKYQYVTDPIYHYQIKQVAKRKPFTALNMIKGLVKNNKATVEII